MNRNAGDWMAVAMAAITVFAVLVGGQSILRYFQETPFRPPISIEDSRLVPDPAPRSTAGPRVSTPFRTVLFRRTLDQVAHDFGIEGRLECAVVDRAQRTR